MIRLKSNNVPAFRKLAVWWDVTINNHHTTNNQKILGMNAMCCIRELKRVDLSYFRLGVRKSSLERCHLRRDLNDKNSQPGKVRKPFTPGRVSAVCSFFITE